MAHADEPCRTGASCLSLVTHPISPHPHKSSECMAWHCWWWRREGRRMAHATCPMDHDTPLFRFSQPPTPSTPPSGTAIAWQPRAPFPAIRTLGRQRLEGSHHASVTSVGRPKLRATQKRLGDRNNGRHQYQRRGREMRECGATVRLTPVGCSSFSFLKSGDHSDHNEHSNLAFM